MQDFFTNLFDLIADLFLRNKISGKDTGILGLIGAMLDSFFGSFFK